MNWLNIHSQETIDSIIKNSFVSAQLIFKHSTRCSVSSVVKNRLESKWNFEEQELTPCYLDLLCNREISNYLAERFAVEHESPQVIVIKNGCSVYSASQMFIDLNDIREKI